MVKMRAGIEIPIIPEDFVVTEEDLCHDMLESSSPLASCSFQDGLNPTDWIITKIFIDRYPKT